MFTRMFRVFLTVVLLVFLSTSVRHIILSIVGNSRVALLGSIACHLTVLLGFQYKHNMSL